MAFHQVLEMALKKLLKKPVWYCLVFFAGPASQVNLTSMYQPHPQAGASLSVTSAPSNMANAGMFQAHQVNSNTGNVTVTGANSTSDLAFQGLVGLPAMQNGTQQGEFNGGNWIRQNHLVDMCLTNSRSRLSLGFECWAKELIDGSCPSHWWIAFDSRTHGPSELGHNVEPCKMIQRLPRMWNAK